VFSLPLLSITSDLVPWGTAVLAAIGVVTLLFTYREVRSGVKIRVAERAERLVSRLIDIEQVAVDHPHLAPYFQRGEPVPDDSTELRDQILAYALLYTDFGEIVGWQIHAGQMSDGADDWREYLSDLYRKTPAVREVLARDRRMLAAETRWLFGGPATEAVRDLGIKDSLELCLLRGKPDHDLLSDVHRVLFLSNFPDPDEQESVDDWASRLWEDVRPPHPEQHGAVAGLFLDDPDRRILAGFAFVERYVGSRCGLLSYIAVDPCWRGQRLSTRLFDEALQSASSAAHTADAPLKAIFAEIHDPARVQPRDDSIDPAARAAIMAALGGRRIPISYVQPALSPASARSDRLMLIAYPQDGSASIPSETISSFLNEYFHALDVADVESDPDFTRMIDELERLGPDVELQPLVA
jgi:GNAT superfamily N-acetyltransferase